MKDHSTFLQIIFEKVIENHYRNFIMHSRIFLEQSNDIKKKIFRVHSRLFSSSALEKIFKIAQWDQKNFFQDYFRVLYSRNFLKLLNDIRRIFSRVYSELFSSFAPNKIFEIVDCHKKNFVESSFNIIFKFCT